MHIVIVDDEELARARLLRMLQTLGYTHISQAQSADEAIELVKTEHVDTLFLDINMPKINGLELGYELRYLSPNSTIIYQSAYDEHALKAFDIGAVGYLVKPYSLQQLQQSLERLKSLAPKEGELRILSKSGESYFLLKPQEIFYVKADLSEVILRSAKGFSYYAQKISELQKKLQPHNFVRIHRSYLLNLDAIKEIETIEQSKLRFHFKNISESIESSKDGAKMFRERFLGSFSS